MKKPDLPNVELIVLKVILVLSIILGGAKLLAVEFLSLVRLLQ